MKFIRSQAEQAKYDYVRELEKKNAALETENRILRAQVSRYGARLGVKSRSHYASAKSSSTERQKTVPMYAMATVSSIRRVGVATDLRAPRADGAQQKLPSRHDSPVDWTNAWNDGKLVYATDLDELHRCGKGNTVDPHFMRHTSNTQRRSKDCGKWTIVSCDSVSAPEKLVIAKLDPGVSTYSAYLAEKTGIHKVWSGPDTSCLFISDEDWHLILRRGIDLAQEIVWDACHVDRPEEQAFWQPQGPRMVKLGRDELISRFGLNFCKRITGWRQTDIDQGSLHAQLFELTDLRNHSAHNIPCTVGKIRQLLSPIHELAVIVHDRHRAEKAAALDDDLENKANQAFEEIVFGRALPFAPDWALHHQATFHSVNTGSTIHTNIPEEIVRAATEWNVGKSNAGELDDDYVSRCQRPSWTDEQLRFITSMSGEEREFYNGMRFFDELTAGPGELEAGGIMLWP